MDKLKAGMPPGIKVALSLLAFYLFLKLAIYPPIPSSVVFMYMSLALIGATLYLTLFFNIKETVMAPLFAFLGGGVEGRMAKGGRYAVLIAMPLFIWFSSYQKFAKTAEAPLDLRVIHPAPPVEYTGLYNPFQTEDQEERRKFVGEGKMVYYKNCVFCHGDLLDGKGIFSHGFNPAPANFQDPGTIAMLQESFLFWRVSTGGPGLPQESTPWSSAMPRWENMLTEEERWKVILFLYDYTGFKPRTWE